MKRIITSIILLLTLASGLSAQQTASTNYDVPEIVRKSLYKDFNWVKRDHWTRENDNQFVAEFTVFGETRTYTATYDSSGHLLEHLREVDYKTVPAKGRVQIEKKFQGFTPSLAIWAESPDTDDTVFVVVMEKWTPGRIFKQSYHVALSEKGEVLRTSEVNLELASLN